MKRLFLIAALITAALVLFPSAAHAQVWMHVNGCAYHTPTANCGFTVTSGNCVYGIANNNNNADTVGFSGGGGTWSIAKSLTDASNGLTYAIGVNCTASGGSQTFSATSSPSGATENAGFDQFSMSAGLDGTVTGGQAIGSVTTFTSGTAGGNTAQAHELVYGGCFDAGASGTVTPNGATLGQTATASWITTYADSGASPSVGPVVSCTTTGASGPIKDAIMATFLPTGSVSTGNQSLPLLGVQ